MTTAHRPTWVTARGGGTARDLGRTVQYSSRDLPGHLSLKERHRGQGRSDEVGERDLKAELLERERENAQKRKREARTLDDEDLDGEVIEKVPRLVDAATAALDADDKDSSEEEDEDSDDDSEDDTAMLLRELENIKREKAEEQAKKEEEERKEAERIRTENLLLGNPLLAGAQDFAVKKRWDDDVVFKNCARGVPLKPEARYVNDTIRGEFHKKFMKKYVQ